MWTDPNAHRHTAQLLDDSASLSPLREQQHQHHHQLAHVGQPTANTKSHMKIAFSQEKDCSKHMTFAAWPTAGSVSYHHMLEEGRRTLPSQQQGTLCLCSQYPLPSQGKERTKRNPTTRQEVPRSSPRWAGNLRQRGDTRTYLTGCCKLCSEKGDSARGTDHYG